MRKLYPWLMHLKRTEKKSCPDERMQVLGVARTK